MPRFTKFQSKKTLQALDRIDSIKIVDDESEMIYL